MSEAKRKVHVEQRKKPVDVVVIDRTSGIWLHFPSVRFPILLNQFLLKLDAFIMRKKIHTQQNACDEKGMGGNE